METKIITKETINNTTSNRKEIARLIRAASGIHVVAIMTAPLPCPGQCIYCFGGPEYGTPKSYLGNEPALMRAIQNNFHPYKQVNNRLNQYTELGHKPTKIELIVMGGTFTALSLNYQEWFIAQAIQSMNDYPNYQPDKNVILKDAIKENERAQVRCIGIVIETRPDYAKEYHIDRMLNYGTTRVEIGVQTIYNDVLKLIKRGHTVEESIEATRRLKDAGLKVGYHMMLALPGNDPERDFKAFKRIFEDTQFRPDMIKIYPTLVIEGSELYEWWKKGEYKPYDLDTTVNLIAKILSITPEWIRIMRIQRDVPATIITDGIKKSNLRELAEEELKQMGKKCRCIRCREVGLKQLKQGIIPDESNIKLITRKYYASEGIEYFISFEDPTTDTLIGFLRLRRPSDKAWRKEITETETAIIRELHVYGIEAPIGERLNISWQHRGYGSRLLLEAEKIAREELDARKILVISGIGVKPYYRRMGYMDDGPYLSKKLI